MRSVGVAGWSQHGYYGLSPPQCQPGGAPTFPGAAKTFGNPGGALLGDGYFVPGAGGAPQPVLTGFPGLVFGSGGFMLGGFFPAAAPVIPAVRAGPDFLPLATTADTSLTTVCPTGVSELWAVPTGFVALDEATLAMGCSTDGVIWHVAQSSGGQPDFPQSFVGDDLHHTVVYYDDAGLVWVSSDAVPFNFSTQGVLPGAISDPPGLAWKGPGTGVLLLGTSGGAGNVFKSLDGGMTWAAAGNVAFAGGFNFLGFGVTQWLAIGDDGAGKNQFSVSTDDGTTWSPPADLPGANNIATGFVTGATNHANGWFIGNLNAASPDNYWVSDDDGSTWDSPNLFANPGWQEVVFGGGIYNTTFTNVANTGTVLATSSSDGRNWTLGPTVTEAG